MMNAPFAFRAACFAAIGFLFPPFSATALLINNFDPAINDWDRSGTQPTNFIGKNFDWSGIGRSNTGWWATMIGPWHFVSANHANPGVGSVITFFLNNGTTVTRQVSASSPGRIGTSDLWVGELDNFVPAGVASYDIFTSGSNTGYGNRGVGADLRSGTGDPEDITDILFMVGRINGSTGSYGTEGGTSVAALNQLRVGINASPFIPGAEEKNLFGSQAWAVEIPYEENQNDEAYFITGDSGGPTMFAPSTNISGELLLYGIHSANSGDPTTGNAPTLGDPSLDSLPGKYLTEINQILLNAPPIPEPAAIAFWFGLTAVFVVGAGKTLGRRK